MTEPEPTLVMPTSRPPRAPTSSVGIGRIRGSSVEWWPVADPAQVDPQPQRVRQRGEEQREADAELEHPVELLGVVGGPRDEVGAQQRHRDRPEDQPLGEREVGRALALVHDRAAGLVDRGGRQVGGHHGGGLADAEEDQGRRHQGATAHAGQAHHDADEEARRQDGEERAGDHVDHALILPDRVSAGTTTRSSCSMLSCAPRRGLGAAAVGVGHVVRPVDARTARRSPGPGRARSRRRRRRRRQRTGPA